MTTDTENEISQALKDLTRDHQSGLLSLATYRQRRRALLERVDGNQDTLPDRDDRVPATARPGVVVWSAFVVIVLLIATVTWLLR